MTDTPPYLRPYILDVPLPRVESVDDVDLYLPQGQATAPAVVLIHGGPIPADAVSPRQWPGYVGHGSVLAAAGLVGVMVQHRFTADGPLVDARDDVLRAIQVAATHPRVDPSRLAVWASSAGGWLLGPLLADPPASLRAVVAMYAVLGADEDEEDGVPSPVGALAHGLSTPTLVVRVEHERDFVAETVATWLATVEATDGADVTVLDVAGAHHGFETIDHTDAARQAIGDVAAWLVARLA